MEAPPELLSPFNSSVERILISTLASMIAASIVISIFYPIEYIEGRMQIGMIQKTSLFLALKKTSPELLYTGYIASVVGHIFAWGAAIFFSEVSKLLFVNIFSEGLSLGVSCKI